MATPTQPTTTQQTAPRNPAWKRATSRPKIPAYSEPNAGANLELGEFQHDPSLSSSEARLLLNIIVNKRREIDPDNSIPSLQQMQDYLDMFARFRTPQVVSEIESIFQELPETVNSFERSQLKTLAPEDAEEAKTLIPSLQDKVENPTLDTLLLEMQNMRAAGEE